jgi:hypothetical protein
LRKIEYLTAETVNPENNKAVGLLKRNTGILSNCLVNSPDCTSHFRELGWVATSLKVIKAIDGNGSALTDIREAALSMFAYSADCLAQADMPHIDEFKAHLPVVMDTLKQGAFDKHLQVFFYLFNLIDDGDDRIMFGMSRDDQAGPIIAGDLAV